MGSVTYQCQRPLFQDGMCYQHFQKSVIKSTPWGERHNYRDATEQEFRLGKHLQLKTGVKHVMYRQRNGAIQRYDSKTNKWLDTDLDLNYTHFCIKSFDR